MQDSSSQPIPFNRPVNPREKALLDMATKDIYTACRTALLLIRAARESAGLSPLAPPPG